MIAPKFVAPYRMSGKRGKDDVADAAAICEAVQRPCMAWAVLARDERYDPEAWRRHARTQPSDATGMPMPSAVGIS